MARLSMLKLKELRPHSNLKELWIDGYRGEIFPDWLGLSSYSNITKLLMYSCEKCRQLPPLGELPSLQHLEIWKLHGLERIGEEFYKSGESCHQGTPFRSLEKLEFHDMYGWREWHTPDKLDVFPKLKTLKMEDCPVLSGDLPASLPTLEKLLILDCEELACSLPRSPKLHTISVNGSTLLGETHEVSIADTQQVQSVLECLRHIQPPCIQRLIIERCWSAISISGDYLPASLKYLRIKECLNFTFPATLEHKLLTEIHVYRCDSVTLLPLGALPNLKILRISECGYLVSLPSLGFAVPHLEYLYIGSCPEIDCFREECLPPSLTTLEIYKCKKLERWIKYNGFHSGGLTHLILKKWNQVMSFPREGCLPASLQSLRLFDFPYLETLDYKGLHHLTSLQELTIGDCPTLENITQENLPASISKLSISNCEKLERWITSNGLNSEGLTHLSLFKVYKVKSFPTREGCLPASLQSLSLSDFPNLETLDCKGLHHLTSLTELSIKECPKLKNITEENLPASVAKLCIWGQCPLWSKLKEMNDPRIQLKEDSEYDY